VVYQQKQQPNHHSSYRHKSVLVVGGSGFIGQSLIKQLIELRFQVTVYTRNLAKTKSIFLANYLDQKIKLVDRLNLEEQFQVIINLAGKPLDEARWNEKVKGQIIESRIQSTQMVTDYISQTNTKPELLINGSAIGFYGPRDNQKLIEEAEGVDSFSHQLCASWEQQAIQAEQFGVRVCLLRTGIVLGVDGGALDSMILPFKLYLGGPFGSGCQWMSWIHMDDLVSMIIWLFDKETINGPVNGVAPSPVTNQYFSQTLASILKRPAKLRMPAVMARLLFGEMADELLLQGQRVIPKLALDNGFKFQFSTLGNALENIILRSNQ
jgi:uncharacterized protein